jgi:hypothetical protein
LPVRCTQAALLSELLGKAGVWSWYAQSVPGAAIGRARARAC